MVEPGLTPEAQWELAEWERRLTIHVGEAYVCRQCENLVMVTKGGVGVMELICCGKPMERVPCPRPAAE